MAPQEPPAELLDRVTSWVLEHGLTGLSLRPLARDLGTSDRMLLYYFGSKDTLIDAVLARANARLAASVTPATERLPWAESGSESSGDASRASAALVAMWERLSTPETAPYLRLYFEVFGLALQQPDRYRTALLGVHSAWLGLTATLLAPGDPTGATTVVRATAAVGLLEGLLLDLLVTGERDRVAAAVAKMAPQI